jgi:hypothetical protein
MVSNSDKKNNDRLFNEYMNKIKAKNKPRDFPVNALLGFGS